MKGLVLEIRGGVAAVLCEDGTVEKVRRPCRVGQTIELEARDKITPLPRKGVRWAAAAAAALVIVSAGGVYGYNNAYAYSYVTLDANPSIEYVLNRRNRLLSVSPLNDDAQGIVDELNAGGVARTTISDALDRTKELLYQEDYLGEDGDNLLVISVSSRGEAQLSELTEELSVYFDEREDEALTVYVTSATREEARAAESLGVSTGRYKLIEDLAGRDDVTESELRRLGEAPVGELIDRGGLPEDALLFAENVPERTPPTDSQPPAPEQEIAPNDAAPGQERTQAPNDAAPESGQGQPPSGAEMSPAEPQPDARDAGGASGEPS